MNKHIHNCGWTALCITEYWQYTRHLLVERNLVGYGVSSHHFTCILSQAENCWHIKATCTNHHDSTWHGSVDAYVSAFYELWPYDPKSNQLTFVKFSHIVCKIKITLTNFWDTQTDPQHLMVMEAKQCIKYTCSLLWQNTNNLFVHLSAAITCWLTGKISDQ